MSGAGDGGEGPRGPDDPLDDPGQSPDRARVGEPADEHGTTVAPEPDTLTTGSGERIVDPRSDDEGQDAVERHRRRAAAVGEPTPPAEGGEPEEDGRAGATDEPKP